MVRIPQVQYATGSNRLSYQLPEAPITVHAGSTFLILYYVCLPIHCDTIFLHRHVKSFPAFQLSPVRVSGHCVSFHLALAGLPASLPQEAAFKTPTASVSLSCLFGLPSHLAPSKHSTFITDVLRRKTTLIVFNFDFLHQLRNYTSAAQDGREGKSPILTLIPCCVTPTSAPTHTHRPPYFVPSSDDCHCIPIIPNTSLIGH